MKELPDYSLKDHRIIVDAINREVKAFNNSKLLAIFIRTYKQSKKLTQHRICKELNINSLQYNMILKEKLPVNINLIDNVVSSLMPMIKEVFDKHHSDLENIDHAKALADASVGFRPAYWHHLLNCYYHYLLMKQNINKKGTEP